MPRPNALLESLDKLHPRGIPAHLATFQHYDPSHVAPNYDPERECPHKPWQTYTRAPCVCGRELWPPRGRGRGESLYSPRRLKAKMRAIDAIRLRGQGYRWRVIAERLGYSSAQGAWNAVRRTGDLATAIRNYEQWRRENGGRPHYPRPSPEVGKRILAEMDAIAASDRAMHAERIAIAEEQLARRLMSEAG